MKGHTIFVCSDDDCPIVTFVEWSNQANSPSGSSCPVCSQRAEPVKAIYNKEHPTPSRTPKGGK